MAQGWNQVHGLDCGSTFSPVCRLQSVRIFVAITVEYDLDMDHMDVSTAFLYADIQEKVFVEQAPGVVKDKDGGELVMQLEKNLYGLAQSPGNRFHTTDPVLVDIGFVPLKFDTCVYVYNREGVKILVTLYVDDLLAGNNAEAMAMVKSQLKQRFKMTDMGEASLLLGIGIKKDRQVGTLTSSQEAYSKSTLERFGMSVCKPASAPG